jgi:catechol 2,3-dioxygenase-like lactoylglutathione lyase family enzyme
VQKLLADHIDHIVLTVSDIEKTTQFYEAALGFEREFFRGRKGNRVMRSSSAHKRSTCKIALPILPRKPYFRHSAPAISA